MNENELTIYHELLGEIKVRVRQAQIKAALSANAKMILMYWDIGRMIADRQAEQGFRQHKKDVTESIASNQPC